MAKNEGQSVFVQRNKCRTHVSKLAAYDGLGIVTLVAVSRLESDSQRKIFKRDCLLSNDKIGLVEGVDQVVKSLLVQLLEMTDK